MSKATQSAYVPNSYQTPNILVDILMPLLSPQEWMVLSFATRHILGWQDKIASRQANISVSQFMKCGLARQAILTALDALDKYHILKKIGKPTADGQLWELAFDDGVDLDGLQKRAADNHDKGSKRTTKARSVRQTSKRRSVAQTSGQSDRPDVVSQTDRQVVSQTDTTKHNLQTQSSNTYLSQSPSGVATDALGDDFDAQRFTPKTQALLDTVKAKTATAHLSAEEPDRAVTPETKTESVEPVQAELVTASNRLIKDQFYIHHKDTAVGPFKGFKTANDYKFARSLPGTIAQGAGIGTVGKVDPPEDKRATPDQLFSWVAINVIKNDPQVAYDSKRLQKFVFSLMAPIVNAEKRLLKVKVLPQADRDRVAGEMDGWLKWYPTICKGCNIPQDLTTFEKYVNQWYAAGKPGSQPAPAKRRADPACPHCHGAGVVVAPDERGNPVTSACTCVKAVRNG